MWKRLWVFCTLACALCAADKPVVKIGAILPMSGELAVYGQTLQKAATMAMDEIGETKLDYKIIYEDDQGMTKYDVMAAQKLVNVDKVNAMITMWDAWFVVAPTTDPKQIPHLGMSWDYGDFRSAYNFNRYPTNGQLIQKFFDECKLRGYKRVAFVALKGGGTLIMQKSIKELAPKNGIDMVFSEFVNPADRDFRTLVAKIADAKPDVVMCLMWPPSIDIFLLQWHQYKYDIPVSGIELWFHTQLKKEFEGSWDVSSDVPGTKFALGFEKRFGIEPMANAGHMYDNVTLLVNAHEALYAQLGRIPTGQEVVGWIKEHPVFDGAQGRTEINANNQIVSEPAVCELKGGKIIKLR